MGQVTDVVLLVPGFLGYDHFGGYPYFSQPVPAAIRVALEASRALDPNQLAIAPCATDPSGSLARRQRVLSSEAARVVAMVQSANDDPAPVPRIHFVAHSTGAVDAELFVATNPLEGEWTAEERTLRAAVRSISSVAGPLAGTNIAVSAVTRFFAGDGTLGLETVRETARLAAAALELGPANIALSQLLAGGLTDLHPVVRFVLSILKDRSVLADLRPDKMKAISEKLEPDPALSPVRKARFVTVARREPNETTSGQLFEALYALTAMDAAPPLSPQLLAAMNRAVTDGSVPIIGATAAPLPITGQSSDAVVNTARQIPLHEIDATPLKNVNAFVVADHLDVLGGFPMTFAANVGSDANGFLNSGSRFRGPEFSALYRRIAAVVTASRG